SLARGMCMPSFTFSSVNSAVPSFPTRRSSALGRTPDGQVLLADELLTPDSSRFWRADDWQPGRPQHSPDKQFVRDWAASTGWDKKPPAPQIPEPVVAATRERYIQVYDQITGERWTCPDARGDPPVRRTESPGPAAPSPRLVSRRGEPSGPTGPPSGRG